MLRWLRILLSAYCWKGKGKGKPIYVDVRYGNKVYVYIYYIIQERWNLYVLCTFAYLIDMHKRNGRNLAPLSSADIHWKRV